MKKAKIYIPAKTAMQFVKLNWVLEFETKDFSINPLMAGDLTDTLEEVILKFSSKEKQLNMQKIILLIMLLNPKKKIYY